ncbi:MAG: hypothetical protein M5U08_00775 [Burkholderiales bacterium]|nr:hypothetical protein [Burkholderiales bacterium]
MLEEILVRRRPRAHAARPVLDAELRVVRGLRLERRDARGESDAAELLVDLVHARDAEALAVATVRLHGLADPLAHAELVGARRALLRCGGRPERIREVGRLRLDALEPPADGDARPGRELREVLGIDALAALIGVQVHGGGVEQRLALRLLPPEVPVGKVVADDQAVARAERTVGELEARREGPRAGARLDVLVEEPAEEVVAEERAALARAVAEIGRELALAERDLAGEQPACAVARRPVVRRAGAPRIARQLRLGARAGQPQVLAVSTELDAERPGTAEPAQIGFAVALSDAVVLAPVVRLVVVQREGAARLVAGDRASAAKLDGVEPPDARRHRAGARAALGRARDDVDRAAGRTAAVQHAAAAAHDLDALDRLDGDRRPGRVGEIDLVQSPAVEQEQRVLVGGDAEAAQIHLLVGAPGEVADRHAGLLREELRQRARGARGDVLGGDDGHPDRRVQPVLREARRGDRHRLHDGRSGLRERALPVGERGGDGPGRKSKDEAARTARAIEAALHVSLPSGGRPRTPATRCDGRKRGRGRNAPGGHRYPAAFPDPSHRRPVSGLAS